MLKVLFFLVGLSHGAIAGLAELKFSGYVKDDEVTWSDSKTNSRIIIARELEDSWFDIQEKDVSSYLKKNSEIRSVLNVFGGIAEWKIRNSNFKSISDRKELTFEGEMTAFDKQIYFVEQQIFIKNRVYQIAIRSKNKEDLSRNFVDPIIQSFQTELR